MGVLKVNVGDAVTPDWRKIGCGSGSMWGADADDLPSGWVDLRGTWGVRGGAATPLTRDAAFTAVAYKETGAADGTVTVRTLLSGSAPGLVFRVQDVNNFWVAIGLGVYEVNGGVFTQRITYGAGSATAAQSIAVILSGTSITFQVDGVTRGSYTSAFLQSETKHGMYGQNVYNGSTDDLIAEWSFPSPSSVVYPGGRLKLWTGTEWVREACDGDTGGHPLKMWDGSTWQTVACMVPL